jgi:hypothetical protein
MAFIMRETSVMTLYMEKERFIMDKIGLPILANGSIINLMELERYIINFQFISNNPLITETLM